MKRATQEVHAGRGEFGDLGVHAPPIDLSTTNPVPTPQVGADSLASLNAGGHPQGTSVYGRQHNPTVARFEAGLAALEGAEAAVAFGSGMAALTALVLAHPGHLVVVRPVYGGTDGLLGSGILPNPVTQTTACGIADAIRPDTSLVLVETPTNPLVTLVDIEAAVAAAGPIPVAVDSTFATPALQQPLRHGARYVWHSATKFLGGHGDVLAGVVACSEADARGLRRVRVATGAILHPLGGYLLHRGLQTLSLRVERAQHNAAALAVCLSAHPEVRSVHYPGLPGQDPEGVIGRQMSGPGTMLAIDVGSRARAQALMAGVQLWTAAVSLGSVDSLIQHPGSFSHATVSEAVRAGSGIGPGVLRLSVGIEDVDDLRADLRTALDAIHHLQ